MLRVCCLPSALLIRAAAPADWCINCGRHFNNTIGVWTSPDLSPASWVRRAEAIGAGWPSAMYYRSHALFNARTKKFVLWANVGAGPGGPYAVAGMPPGP